MREPGPGAAPRPDEPAPRVTLAVHDRKQLALEIRHPPGSAVCGGSHDVELFLFIPRNVGLTAANYPGAQFYHDLTAYLRLDLPDLGLEDLCASPRSPLRRLDVHLAELARGQATPDPIGIAVKLFGHEFTEAVHRARTRLSPVLDAATDRGAADRARELAISARAALERLREARHRFAPFRRVAPDVWAVFQQTDEYASLFLDESLAMLAHELGARPERPGGAGEAAGVLDVLSACAAAEARYRHAQGFVNLDPASGLNREYFLYRRSLLKKAVHQALWVRTRRRQVDSYLRNAAGMVAAGMAATWALIAQVPSQLLSLSPVTQALMFVLPVIGYVLKDRIKELTREWMIRRMRACDQETELVGLQLARSGLGSLGGTLREEVRFVDHAPDDVVAIRQRGRWIAGARIGGELVLAYRRKLDIVAPRDRQPRGGSERGERGGGGAAGAAGGAGGESLRGIDLALRQIIRLSLRHFMARLDDRDQIVRHYDPSTGGFATHEIAKVYHLDAVVRVAGPHRAAHLERWRVVFSRAGIERIEPGG
jgi:hypothetical protein